MAFWAFVVFTSILLFPFAVLVWILTVLFDRRLVALHRFTCFWASLYTWCNPGWRVTIAGREHIEHGRTYMLVANHLSLLDILLLFRLFKDFKWVSKVENFRVPVIGWNMTMNRYIPLKRGDRDSVKEMMATCNERIGEGSSIMMFPEGTRSRDGAMRPFKPGAFELARRNQLAVVPIVIQGTHDALPRRGFVLQGRHAITVTVLPEVPMETVTSMTTPELTEYVRDVIGEVLTNPR